MLTTYKCFIHCIKITVAFGYYNIPIRYSKKLVLAVLFVYCSTYPTFVLGVILMLAFINMIITICLKPYRYTFEIYLFPVIDALFIMAVFAICAMQLPYLQLTSDQKSRISYFSVAVCLLLSLLLIIHNFIINCVEIMKFFTNKDCLSSYYKAEFV